MWSHLITQTHARMGKIRVRLLVVVAILIYFVPLHFVHHSEFISIRSDHRSETLKSWLCCEKPINCF